MADFVVKIGIAPSEYKALTIGERQAIIRAHNRANTKS